MIIIKITFHMFYFYWGEESCSLYQGIVICRSFWGSTVNYLKNFLKKISRDWKFIRTSFTHSWYSWSCSGNSCRQGCHMRTLCEPLKSLSYVCYVTWEKSINSIITFTIWQNQCFQAYDLVGPLTYNPAKNNNLRNV